ncbi:radical SAM protein [Candidatus Poribacteria bacterium]|nr:radical SAM protein [Candidatus Poribacteria bacterium]
MIGISRLLNGTVTTGDALRYGRSTARGPAHLLHYSDDKKPVVVWNCTQRCNLRCIHCYANSRNQEYPGELTTDEAMRFMDDLAAYKVPTVLFSGGEPLMRPDLFEIAEHARGVGLRAVLSTNGTLIDDETADRIRDAGFTYAGISLDGIGAVHDRIRGVKGAFEDTLEGLRRVRDRGVRVGLRFTVHAKNVQELPAIFELMAQESIPRCCIYHLAYAGRGEKLSRYDLTPEETRSALDLIFEQARLFHQRGIDLDLLTVDNHTDNAYLYMRLREDDPDRAEDVLKLLQWNGGNQSGIAIAAVDPRGNVHPDQFSWEHTFGNVRERAFGDIWMDRTHPYLAILKDRKSHLKGRCAVCKWQGICNGNLRIRAESYFGDPLAPDPGCYLTDEECGIQPGTPEAAAAAEFLVPIQVNSPQSQSATHTA